jgi:hypothetical protein
VYAVFALLFAGLNDAVAAAKQHTTRPVTATFADIDNIVSNSPATDLISRFAPQLTAFDAFAFQVYRGSSFGNYFDLYGAESNGKPLIIAEYGVDAMNDPCGQSSNGASHTLGASSHLRAADWLSAGSLCPSVAASGWAQNYAQQPCADWSPGENGQPGGSDVPADPSTFVGCSQSSGDNMACAVPGVTAQAEWDSSLTAEIASHPAVLGGFLFEWADEWWKSGRWLRLCAARTSAALCTRGRV